MDKFVKNYRKLNGISEYRIIRFSKTISSSFLILKLIDNFERFKSKSNFGWWRKKNLWIIKFYDLAIRIKFPRYFSFFSNLIFYSKEIEMMKSTKNRWLERKRLDKDFNKKIRNFRIMSFQRNRLFWIKDNNFRNGI